MKYPLTAVAVLCAGALTSTSLHGQALFSDSFDTDSSGDWDVFDDSLNGIPDATVIFAHDYSTDQYSVTRGATAQLEPVPKNPFDTGDNTLALKLAVNSDAEGSEASVSLYPKEMNLSGDYALRFEMFQSYNGGAFGGTGSTELATFGIGHSGELTAFLDGNAAIDGDGTFFAVSGEGGASRDYRAYAGDGFTEPTFLDEQSDRFGFTDIDGDGIGEYNAFAGGPLERIFPFPPHETKGAVGKGWVRVEVRLVGGEVTWVINGHIIAHLTGDSVLTDGGKIMLGYSDPFASIADPGEENFVLFDNVRVVSLDGVASLPVVGVTVEGETVRNEESGLDEFQAVPIEEAGVPAVYTVSRTGSTAEALEVSYQVEVRAKSGAVAGTGGEVQTVTIPAGAESTELRLDVIPDDAGGPPGEMTVILARSTDFETASAPFASIPVLVEGEATAPQPDILDGAEVVWSEAFESDVSGDWTLNQNSDDSTATFGYDYSIDGIPPAPNSDGGSTLGLKFTANESLQEVSHVTVSPIGQSFSGDHALAFDLWINVNGPLPGGGAGSTEFAAGGLGTTGDHIQAADDQSDGAWFLLTGDGGSGSDIRFFLANNFLDTASGAYPAGDRNSANEYYHGIFPAGKEAPALQKTDFPQQTGSTAVGQAAFDWISVVLAQRGSTVTWLLNGTVVAEIDRGAEAPYEGNIFLGYSDWFSSVSDNVDLSFGLVDNVRVLKLAEPAAVELSLEIALSGSDVVLTFAGTLESAAEPNGPWTTVADAVSPLTVSPGTEAGAVFYRVVP